MQKLTALLISFTGAVAAIGGCIFLLSIWIESRFGAVYVAAFWLMVLLCVAMFVGVLIAGMVQRWTLHGIIGFQEADDRGEVARAHVYREMVRGQREFDKDVRRAALPLAKQHAMVLQERHMLEAQRVQANSEDDWYAIPEADDDDGSQY